MEILNPHITYHKPAQQDFSMKPVKVCEVSKILQKFHIDHPEYAALDAFKGLNMNRAVSYTNTGVPLNAIEDFWLMFQGNSSSVPSKFNDNEGQKPDKVCEVKQILDKFHQDHPDYAALDAFNGVNLNKVVSYTQNGEPMNAIEDFWFNFQSNSQIKLNKNESPKSQKVCQVKQILDKFHKDHPEYAALDAFKGISANQIVSYTPNGEPMNAIEDFWFKCQGNANHKTKQAFNQGTREPEEWDSKTRSNPNIQPKKLKEKVSLKPKENDSNFSTKKVCEVQMVLEKFNKDYPELAKYLWSPTNQVVSCD